MYVSCLITWDGHPGMDGHEIGVGEQVATITDRASVSTAHGSPSLIFVTKTFCTIEFSRYLLFL